MSYRNGGHATLIRDSLSEGDCILGGTVQDFDFDPFIATRCVSKNKHDECRDAISVVLSYELMPSPCTGTKNLDDQ